MCINSGKRKTHPAQDVEACLKQQAHFITPPPHPKNMPLFTYSLFYQCDCRKLLGIV